MSRYHAEGLSRDTRLATSMLLLGLGAGVIIGVVLTAEVCAI